VEQIRFELTFPLLEGDCHPGQNPGQASPFGLLAMTAEASSREAMRRWVLETSRKEDSVVE
jgi:hypothetical protein